MSGTMESWFTTPAFDGFMAWNFDGTDEEICQKAKRTYPCNLPRRAHSLAGAQVYWQTPIKIIPATLEITGGKNRQAKGPSLEILQTSSTKDAPAVYSVTLDCGLRLGDGDGEGGPPILLARGELNTCGTSRLELNTADEWAPLPSTLPAFRIPRLFGEIVFHRDGPTSTTAYHDPVEFGLEPVVSFKDLVLSVQHEALPTAKDSSSRSPQKKCGDAETPSHRQLTKKSEKSSTSGMVLDMSGQINIGGESGLLLSLNASVNLREQSLTLFVVQAGNWCPFQELGAPMTNFCTPPMHGWGRLQKGNMPGRRYLEVQGRITLNTPFVIVPDLLEVIQPNATTADAGGGPVFGVHMVQESSASGQSVLAFANGTLCVKLTADGICLTVHLSARAVNGDVACTGGSASTNGYSGRRLQALSTVAEAHKLELAAENWPMISAVSATSLASGLQSDTIDEDLFLASNDAAYLLTPELYAEAEHGASPRLQPRMLAQSGGSSSKASKGKKGLHFCGISLYAAYIQGDIKPLSVIGNALEDLVVIEATPQQPLAMMVTYNPKSPSRIPFHFHATVVFNPPEIFGIEPLVLPISVNGVFRKGQMPTAIFECPSLENVHLPFDISLAGLRLYFSTYPDSGRRRRLDPNVRRRLGGGPPVILPSGKTIQIPGGGMTLVYEGPSFDPVSCICDTTFVLLLSNPGPGEIMAAFHCPLNLTLLKDRVLPTLNFLRFSSMFITLTSTRALMEIGVGATFEFATGSSNCNGPEKFDQTECLTATFEFSIANDNILPFVVVGVRMLLVSP